MKVENVVKEGALVALLFLPAVEAGGTIVSKGGESGIIEYPIENIGAAGSNRRLEEVQLSVIPPPALADHLTVTSISIKEDAALTQPLTIEPGQTRTFVIAYQLGQNAPEGSHDVELRVEQLNVFAEPSSLSALVPFLLDTVPPKLAVLDPTGTVTAAGPGVVSKIGMTQGRSVSVQIDDLGPSGSGFGSGPGRLEIWQGNPSDGGAQLAVSIATFTNKHLYTSADVGLSELGQMTQGRIFIRAFDRAGNATTASFEVDRATPVVTDSLGNLIFPGATNALFLNILAVDPVVNGAAVGLDRIIAEPLDRLLEGVTIQANGLLSKAVRLPPNVSDTIPPTTYRIQVYDRVGNVQVIQPIIVDHTKPFAEARGQYSPGAAPPPVAFFDGRPNPAAPGCDGNQDRLGVVVGDRLSLSLGDNTGLASLSLRNSFGRSQFPGPFLDLEGSARVTLFASLRENWYALILLDVAGNRTEGVLFVDYAPEDTIDIWTPVQEGEEARSTLQGRVKSSWGLCYVKLLPANNMTVFNGRSTDIDAAPFDHEMHWTPASVGGFSEGFIYQYALSHIKKRL